MNFRADNLKSLRMQRVKFVRAACVLVVIALASLLVLLPARGQEGRQRFRPFPTQRPDRMRMPDTSGPSFGEFTFARTIYFSPYSPYGRRYGGTWATDFPEADNHFIVGLREWAGTNLNIAPRPEQVEILGDNLFDYPLLYLVEPGFMELSTEQGARLNEYLKRGGFLFFDDFWGEYEWENLLEQLRKVDPELQVEDLPLSHPLFHSYLDIEEVVQVPNIYNAMRGLSSEKGGVVPHYMGIFAKNGQMVGFVSRNCDLGDAWEWINSPEYPVRFGLVAYKVGINVIIYAMTH